MGPGENVVAVAGGKGGCGKTTTALGLALAGARMGRAILAVDADVDVPDLHRLAGLDPPDPDPRPVEGAPRVEVLPAPPGADPGDLTGQRPGSPSGYDTVLLDCPAGAGRDAAVPLRAADRTLLVATADPASLRDAAKTAAMSRAVGTPVAGAVLTGTREAPEGVAGVLDTRSVVPVPPADRPLDDESIIDRLHRVFRRLGGPPGHSL